MSNRRVAAVVIFTLTVVARAASAQTPGTPPVVYPRFFETLYAQATQDVRANGGPSLLPGAYGGASALNGLLVAQIVNLPTGSNAGGFAWTYDPTLGTWGRSSDSFGPQTGERSQTVGRRKVNFGFAYQRFTFDKLEGQSISIESAGGLSATSLGLRETVSLSRADVSVKTTFVNYGLTSRIDVGVFIPVVSVAVDGSLTYTLTKGAGLRPPVVSQRTNTASAREERLGDPVFRGKYNFIQRAHGGLAAAFDWRFHGQNQLGGGGGKAQLIASAHSAAVNTHVNVGFSGTGCTDSDELCHHSGGFLLAGGIDKAVTKRVTLSTDIHMQRVDIRRTSGLSITVPLTGPLGPCAQGIASACRSSIIERADTVTLSMTGKLNLWGNLLVTVTGLVPANSSGLTDRFTPIVGLDYAW